MIADTGKGMTAEVRAKAFDPFFTTKEVGKGSGLGLSQVFGMAKQSDGAATIDSTPTSGTTIRVVLPRAAAAAPTDNIPSVAAAPEVSARQATVLVVDDDFQVRESILTALSDQGYRLLEAQSGRQALAMLAEQPVDAAIVDLAMPGMTGPEFARQARLARPDLGLLFVTGYTDRAFTQPAGDHPILRKPFRPAIIVREVATVLDGTTNRKRRV